MAAATIPNPGPLQFEKDLGNIVGKVRSLTPPQVRDVLWAYPLNGILTSDVVELRYYDGLTGQWQPLLGGVSGLLDASKVHVKLDNMTETVGGRGPGNFDGTLLDFMTQVHITYKMPSVAYFTFMGNAGITRPIGYQYPGGSQPFTWGSNLPANVAPGSLKITDVTGGQVVATGLPATGSGSYGTTAFQVQEGEARRFQLEGSDTNGDPFSSQIVINGAVYRAVFLTDQNLLDTAAWTPAAASAFILQQGGQELVFSRAKGPIPYTPAAQYFFYMVDQRLLDGSALGVTFLHNGLPNNGYLYRDMPFTNEYGQQNNVRLLRTNNLLNATYAIESK